MESKIQLVFAIQLAVLGMAHLLRPSSLVQFYEALNSKREGGVVVIGLMSLTVGSFLVVLHNVWTGLPVLLTILGWAQLIKGAVYLLFPSFGLRQTSRVTMERTEWFRWPGVPLLIIAALLGWDLLG